MRGQRHARVGLYPGKDSVPIVQEAGWAPGPVWTGAESLDPTGIRSPDRPARSQSLYRLRYPDHTGSVVTGNTEPKHLEKRKKSAPVQIYSPRI